MTRLPRSRLRWPFDMHISLIVAMAKNRVIGVKDKLLPWHLSADLRRFREKTRGHAVVMGRKTWAKFSRPLPDRLNIVVSRDLQVAPPTLVARTLDDAFRLVPPNETEVFVIGGGEIYRQAMARADRIYLTLLDLEVEGDTSFPEIPDSEFRLEAELPQEENGIRFRYLDYVRR